MDEEGKVFGERGDILGSCTMHVPGCKRRLVCIGNMRPQSTMFSCLRLAYRKIVRHTLSHLVLSWKGYNALRPPCIPNLVSVVESEHHTYGKNQVGCS